MKPKCDPQSITKLKRTMEEMHRLTKLRDSLIKLAFPVGSTVHWMHGPHIRSATVTSHGYCGRIGVTTQRTNPRSHHPGTQAVDVYRILSTDGWSPFS